MWTWLSVEEWDKISGELNVGDEVTVHGAKSGADKENDRAFWGTVVRCVGGNQYIIQDADGNETTQRRRDLRHRKLVTRSFFGVTGEFPPPPSPTTTTTDHHIRPESQTTQSTTRTRCKSLASER